MGQITRGQVWSCREITQTELRKNYWATKMTARDNDTKSLNVYVRAIYYLIQSFVCLPKETPDDLSSDIIQFGAGWKYPFWRFGEIRGRVTRYILDRLKPRPTFVTIKHSLPLEA